jgi:radical SAM protein with 4Fe4S-binding SPASM domain
MAKVLDVQEFKLWQKYREQNILSSLAIEITARCNNNCRHCFNNLPASDKAAKQKELTVAEIESIASQAVDLGAVWCTITGGEPLLRPDFPEIYMTLKKLGLIVSVFTNATLVTQRHIDLFKHYPPRDIEVTVYGATRKTYEKVSRRPGSYEKFLSGLDLLENSSVPFRLKAMAIQSNYEEQKAIAEFCRERTKDFYRFDPQLTLRFDGDQKRNAEIRSERLKPQQIIALEKADEMRFAILNDHCNQLIDKHFEQNCSDFVFDCKAGLTHFNVSYDGKFRLCLSLWEENTIYDLRLGSVTDAVKNFIPRVRNLRFSNQSWLAICRKCPLVNLCNYCPATAHLESGYLDGEAVYYCEVAHLRAEKILNIKFDNAARNRMERLKNDIRTKEKP